MVGFTWYSLINQMDWDVAQRDERDMVNPVGHFDLDRRPRPVAATYRLTIRDFAHLLSTSSYDDRYAAYWRALEVLAGGEKTVILTSQGALHVTAELEQVPIGSALEPYSSRVTPHRNLKG